MTWSFIDNHHLRSTHFRTCDQGSEPPLDDGNESSDDFRCTLGARDKERGRRQQISAFFTLVGCHGLHVSAGILWLLTMMAQVFTKGFRPDIQRRILCFALFWHALDIIWVSLFTVVYLMGVHP